MRSRSVLVALAAPILALLLVALLGATARADDKAPSEKVKRAFPDEVRAVLEKADDLSVLAVVCEREPKEGEDEFRGYPVTKRVTVKADERAALLAQIYEGVDDGGPIAKCFAPHHGLEAKRGDEVVSVVLCFECLQLRVHCAKGVWVVATTVGARNAFQKLLGQELSPDAKFEKKLYGGKKAKEWIDLIAACHARRFAGKLSDEARPGVVALGEALRDDPDPLTRTQAAATLARLGEKAAAAAPLVAEALAQRTEGRDRFNAFGVLRALGTAAEPAVPELEKLLEADASSPESRHLPLAACEVLASIGPAAKRAAPALVRWSDLEKGEVNACQGVVALARIGASDEETVKALAARLASAPWNVKRVLLRALGDLRATGAKAAIEKALADDDARVQHVAKVALAQLAGDPASALPEIEKALAPDRDATLRRFAVGDLRRAGGARAVALLAKLLDDKDSWVRESAAEALGELGPAAKEALPALEKAHADARPDTSFRNTVGDAIDRIRAE